MRGYSNPFRSRASEQQRDLSAFARTFAVGALDVLPDSAWDRLVVLRSAPGGGKTSLMRLFTTPSLELIDARADELEPLHRRLVAMGALSADGPAVLGILLNLARDYQALLDLGAPEDVSTRLFFRLLDARIVAGVIRASLEARGLNYPDDAARVHLRAAPDNELFLERLGGASGGDILKQTLATERETLDLLDSLLPVSWEVSGGTHRELYSLRALSDCVIEVDGQELARKPLVMLDDGHGLGAGQRSGLLEILGDRRLGVSRWYAERLQAMEPDQILSGEIEGRDIHTISLEEAQRKRHKNAYQKVLVEAGNLRAGRSLERYGDETQDFFELLEVEEIELLGPDPDSVMLHVKEGAYKAAAASERLRAWLDTTPDEARYANAVLWRQKQIVIEREQRRRQRPLFEVGDDGEQLDAHISRVTEQARVLLAVENRLPYYAGAERIAGVSSWNVEQFLSVCGDLFEAMLGNITLGERPRLSAARQDAMVRHASDRLWKEIVARIPDGRLLLQLLRGVADFARAQTLRPTGPYAPGVTGVAITMADRRRLLDPAERARIAGGEQLFRALVAGSAFNIVWIELDYLVKDQLVAVIYLNRLLCPRYDLPLGRGGFRERRLDDLASWAAGLASPSKTEQEELS